MPIQRLKLYHYPASRSARVKWALHEVVGDDFDVEKVSLYDGVLHTPEFLSLNPNHNLPVLRIDWSEGSTQHMLESAAIVAFLADAYPHAGLAPAAQASRERADYLQMLAFGGTAMDLVLWQIRVHEHVLLEAQRDTRTVARYRHKFAAEIEPQLSRRLEQAPYICGESFSAADCVVGHSVFWARGYGLCKGDVFRAYISRLSKRPAFQAAFADTREFSAQVAPDTALAAKFTG
jgi:glutathione S-transferase